MDEWFLAGDSDFIVKAKARLEEMVRGAEIMVLSSHNDGIVLNWCTRVLWMDQGRIRRDGPPADVLEAYLGRPVRPVADPVAVSPLL
jgi:lipopolysaccharide transport system ATP-binding protein